MKIGVLGVGPVGEELAKAFARNDEIKLGTRNTTSEKIKKALERVGGSQTTIVGTLDRAVKALANQLNVNSKIVIDATNPIASFQPLTMDVGASTSTPKTRNSKINSKCQSYPLQPDMFYCGGDEEAEEDCFTIN
ncbi:hypothetical protein ABK040_012560 [Willaertia magna]